MLYIVGIGPGNARCITGEAMDMLREAEVIAGYQVYVDLIRPLFPEKEYYATPMTKEKERCLYILEQAGRRAAALVCSGDAGVYGLAGLIYELSPAFPDVEIKAAAGVTAALSGGCLLGAPLTHDFAVISLSDRLTPWELIEKRLKAAAWAGFVICIYNPGGRARASYLSRACVVLSTILPPDTVCGIAARIARPGETSALCPLSSLPAHVPDMFTTIFIGNSTTKIVNGKMITPRGYRDIPI